MLIYLGRDEVGVLSRKRRAVLVVRDAVLLVLSLVILGSQWNRWQEEPVFVVTISISAVYIALSVVDIGLLVARVKWKGYYYANSVYQLIPGFLYLGLLPPLGAIIVALNIMVLVALREKKTAEELAKHPPVPITANFRRVLAVGTVVMLASMLLPVISSAEGSLSLFGFYSAFLTRSALPGANIQPAYVIFALLAIVLSPVAVACGALGLVRRRLSLIGGVFGAVAGVSMVVALSGSSSPAGVGPYVMVGGGVVALAAFFRFKKG